MSRRLGSRYELSTVLGRGGFGEVWAGHDEAGQRFAFKLLHANYARDPQTLERFVRERLILQSLSHPNLVQIRDMVVEGDTLALVMDLVEGGDLRGLLRQQRRLPEAESVRLAGAIGAGLTAIHRAGFVHRDLKPENILLEQDGDIPVPKITDFGISRIASQQNQSTTFAGTPTYSAPELFDNLPPTPASDLYSLGVVLYEMAGGRPPFQADSLISMMRLHVEAIPERPAGVTDTLWRLTEGLLSKDPALRVRAASQIMDVSHIPAGDTVRRPASPTSDHTIPRVPESTVIRPEAAPAGEARWERPDTAQSSPPKTALIVGAAVAAVLVLGGVGTAVGLALHRSNSVTTALRDDSSAGVSTDQTEAPSAQPSEEPTPEESTAEPTVQPTVEPTVPPTQADTSEVDPSTERLSVKEFCARVTPDDLPDPFDDAMEGPTLDYSDGYPSCTFTSKYEEGGTVYFDRREGDCHGYSEDREEDGVSYSWSDSGGCGTFGDGDSAFTIGTGTDGAADFEVLHSLVKLFKSMAVK